MPINTFDNGELRSIVRSIINSTVTAINAINDGSPIATALRPLLETTTLAEFRSALGLGSAALRDAGTGEGDVLILDAEGILPEIDGSQLTNLPVISYTALSDTPVNYDSAAGKFLRVNEAGTGIEYGGIELPEQPDSVASSPLTAPPDSAALAAHNYTIPTPTLSITGQDSTTINWSVSAPDTPYILHVAAYPESDVVAAETLAPGTNSEAESHIVSGLDFSTGALDRSSAKTGTLTVTQGGNFKIYAAYQSLAAPFYSQVAGNFAYKTYFPSSDFDHAWGVLGQGTWSTADILTLRNTLSNDLSIGQLSSGFVDSLTATTHADLGAGNAWAQILLDQIGSDDGTRFLNPNYNGELWPDLVSSGVTNSFNGVPYLDFGSKRAIQVAWAPATGKELWLAFKTPSFQSPGTEYMLASNTRGSESTGFTFNSCSVNATRAYYHSKFFRPGAQQISGNWLERSENYINLRDSFVVIRILFEQSRLVVQTKIRDFLTSTIITPASDPDYGTTGLIIGSHSTAKEPGAQIVFAAAADTTMTQEKASAHFDRFNDLLGINAFYDDTFGEP